MCVSGCLGYVCASAGLSAYVRSAKFIAKQVKSLVQA